MSLSDPLAAEVAKLSRAVKELNARVEGAVETAQLAVLKVTVVTELRYFAAHTQARALTPIANAILACDLPADWWHRRRNATIGEWWALVNVPEAAFKLEHGIESS